MSLWSLNGGTVEYFDNLPDHDIYMDVIGGTNYCRNAVTTDDLALIGWLPIANPVPPAPTLADTQASKIAELSSALNNVVRVTGVYTCPSCNLSMVATLSQTQQLQFLVNYMTAHNIPATQIKDTNNVFQTVTIAQLQGIILDITGFGLAQWQHFWTLEAEVGAATTIAEVEAIVW